MKTNKLTLARIFLCFALVLAVFGFAFAMINQNVTAKADAVEYQDYFGLEDRTSWASGGHADVVTFGLMDFSVTEGNQYFKSSVSDCWYHGNNDIIVANGGKDILQYIYINGECARDLITANASVGNVTANTGTWLANPAAWPIAFETGADCWIRVDKSKFGGSFYFTIKAGFSLIRNDGVVATTSSDLNYFYNGNLSKVQLSTVTFNDESGNVYTTKSVITGQAIGELPAVPAKEGKIGFWTIGGKVIDENTVVTANQTATPAYGLEYQDYLGLEDRTSWASGGHADIVTFGLLDFSITEGNQYFKSSVSDCWYHGNNNIIVANGGKDILQYIYINSECARDLITANASVGNVTANTTLWLSNPAAWPIAVETGADCWIRIDKTKFGGDFTFTIKAGFSILRNDNETIYLSKDLVYTYVNGVLSKYVAPVNYTLSFESAEGSVDAITVTNGQAIANLPEVPAKEGYTGVWTIDGEEITADTVYNYGADKTAVAVYTEIPVIEVVDITETVGLGDWGVPESESDIRYLWIRDNNKEIGTAYPNSYWNDHEDNKNSNYGVDIMEYILIDDESVRSIINANAAGTTSYKGASTFPLSIGGCYAPICIETAGDGIRFKVMVDYKTSFTVTFKAGFTLVNTEGKKLYVAEDVTYRVGASSGDITKVNGDANAQYTLSFESSEGSVEAITVTNGQPIADLPEVPAKEGYIGVWKIDGVKITADTLYTFGEDKTAVAVYTEVVDVTDRLFIENRTSWGAHPGEYYFAFLDMGITYIDGSGNRNNYFNTDASVSNAWYHGNNALIDANDGVDIMEYILINGVSARELVTANATGERKCNLHKNDGGTCDCWMTNPAAYPVYLGTTVESGIMIRIATASVDGQLVITVKAGFSILNAKGQIAKVTEDVAFTYENDALTRDYTLSFEGVEGAEAKTVTFGKAIGELPAIPAQDGYICYWTIDGAEITAESGYYYLSSKTAVATYVRDTFVLSFEGTDDPIDAIEIKSGRAMDNLPEVPEKEGHFGYWTINGSQVSNETVFNYGADVTAVAVYVESIDITDRLFMEDRSWGAHEGEFYVALLDMGKTDGQGTNWLHTDATVNGTWYVGNDALITANGGYDIMEYILINGVSARELITANANGEAKGNACDCWLSNPAAYPVYVETTNGSGFMMRTTKEFAGENWVITIKAGFTIINVDGDRVHIAKDVEFSLNEEGAIVRDYLLTFEGSDDAREITFGELLGELPEVPEKDGYVGVWSIDGEEVTAETPYYYFGNRKVVVTYTAIDYTIIINRANGDVETLTFNDLTKEDVLASIALTEDNLFFAYSWQETLPEVLEFRDYTFTEVATEVPANTRIISYSVSIGVNFTVNVYVEVVGDVPSMRFVMGGREEVVDGVLVDETLGKYVYKFADISASDLAEEFTATLFTGETVIDSVDYSIEAYLNKLALREDLSEELKTLIADVIVYGQKAEELAGKESGIQEIDGFVASEFEDLTESDEKLSNSKNEDVVITNVHVEYDETAKIAVIFRATDATNVTVTVNGEEVEFTLVEDAVGIYKVVTGDLFVTNTGVDYVVRILVDGNEVQWVVYDYNSYIYEVQGDEENELSDLVKAIYNLSKSAKAYSEGE